MNKAILVALSFAAIGPSCEGGTEVGNPLNIGFAAYQLSSTARAAGKVDVDTAWLTFRELKLRASATCEDSAELEVNGPLAVNLLGPIPPELKNLPAATGGYCRIEFKWHKTSSPLPGAPAGLNDVAVFVAGTRRDGKRFEIRSERNDSLELRGRGGSFTIEPKLAGLFIGFDTQRWLTGVDLDAATLGSDGVIHIEKGKNEAQLNAFEANVAAAAKLFKDRNSDGLLNVDESLDSAAVGDGVSR
jgi:hypothetical protein